MDGLTDNEPATGVHAGERLGASKKPIRVLLCDDHGIPRRAIAATLALEKDIEVVGQAANGAEAVELHRVLKPDVIVMDLKMPVMDGFEAMAKIRSQDRGARVLVLTMSDERSDVLGALAEEQAAGYMVKDDPSEEFVRAIRIVARGGAYVSPGPTSLLLSRQHSGSHAALKERDLRLLRMVAEGKTNKQIGKQVSLAERTVKHELEQIYDKLGAENRSHAAALAVQRGLVRLDDRRVRNGP
jgi:DNA-binding NarL/FixJ family response regulator